MNTEVDVTFKWRDRQGRFHKIDAMRTKHLFYVLRMIWNHRMPVPVSNDKNFNRYSFNSFYTDDYFKKAIQHMLPELVKRPDIRDDFREDINWMVNWLKRGQLNYQSWLLEMYL